MTTMSVRKKGLSRRHFIKGTAAVLGAPLFIPSTALGNQLKSAAGDRITLGFIGMGTMNGGHLGFFLKTKDVEVKAVCDVDTTRRENAKQMVEKAYSIYPGYKGCVAYSDFRDLLGRKDIDAVVIATPDHWHAIIALEAVKAAKDVYCEKPLTLTIHEAKQLIDAVRKFDRVFQVGSQQRSSNEFRLACELVRSGRIGKIKTVNVNVGGPSKWCDLPEEKLEPGLDWDRWLGPAPKRPYNSILSPRGVHTNFPNWRLYREYSGGMMTDWGAHHFDIAQWGLGMDESGPVEITPPKDPKATHGVKYLYANGVEMFHVSGKGAKRGVQFVGTNGEIVVDRGHLSSTPEGIVKESLTEKDVHLFKSPGHQRNWLDCIRSRKQPLCHVEIGARSVTVCHLGNLAYWYHRPLKWDPQKWEFPGDDEANQWRDRERRGPWQLPKV
jgi:predicted dehydrogenase